ncbi:type II and III secretion system protein family protein [Sphingomonas immobilis]|uniref:Type II and III secretion system protein family protein n=1 Tax=Sphingomonas immobilis TaxID=3063997 RepID=A0ABT8ZVI5_9SPHN|nr:type II and III secretion system protein family protein [Sphingomonas sp. CA1-15]MDO7841010.1 type II and III secretion system protein family protein [Sphingomonas sp. CA1-15]
MNILSKSIGWPLAVALAAGTAAATPPRKAAPKPKPAPAASIQGGVIQLSTGRGRLINLPRPISDVFVASDATADVQVRSPTQIYVFGKGAGETTISATNKAGGVVFSATVRVGNNFDTIQTMLNLAMPDSHIVATTMNGLVLLTGTTAAPGDGAEAERLVQAYVGQGTQVISRLKNATPLQINLQVRFAEVSRSFVKNIGVNVQTSRAPGYVGQPGVISSNSGKAGTITYAPRTDPLTGQVMIGPDGLPLQTVTSTPAASAQRAALALAGRAFGVDLLAQLELGERDGQVTTLANPNLTALSGETGTFLAGGELPIPMSQGLGAVSVEYKQYGISLAYTPTVLGDGRISLRVRPEVSELDYANAVTIAGTTVPGVTTRRTETTVELGSGQSFMIAGLLQNKHNNTIDKTPGAGDLPVLGALFRSNAFQRNETELVIVITPYLVKPVNASDIVLPTDGYKAPTDLGRVLMGQLETGMNGGKRPVPTMAPPVTASPAIGAVTPGPLAPAQAPVGGHDRAATDKILPRDPKPAQAAAAVTPGFDIN